MSRYSSNEGPFARFGASIICALDKEMSSTRNITTCLGGFKIGRRRRCLPLIGRAERLCAGTASAASGHVRRCEVFPRAENRGKDPFVCLHKKPLDRGRIVQ